MSIAPRCVRWVRVALPNRTRACQRALAASVCALLVCLAPVASAEGSAPTRARIQSLDEQVQEIKSDVLGIAAELASLEEKLLFPSNTQVAVFVSLEEDEAFRLDSVEIQIDGEPAAHHIYSFKELEALQRGGVQRLFTGNVSTGDHRLDVSVAGKSGETEVDAVQTFTFRKQAEPKLVELKLAHGAGGASIELGSR